MVKRFLASSVAVVDNTGKMMEHKDMSGTEEVNQGEPYINLFEKKY